MFGGVCSDYTVRRYKGTDLVGVLSDAKIYLLDTKSHCLLGGRLCFPAYFALFCFYMLSGRQDAKGHIL